MPHSLITQIIQDKFLNVFHALFNYDGIKIQITKGIHFKLM